MILEPDVYNLTFESGKYAGLQVKVNQLEYDAFRSLVTVANMHTRVQPNGLPTEEDMNHVDRMVDALAHGIVSWNLQVRQREGRGVVDVPVGALRQQPPDLVVTIILSWINAMSTVQGTTASVIPFDESSIPMDVA